MSGTEEGKKQNQTADNDLWQKIWEKRSSFAKNNLGKYPNSLILSRDVYQELILILEIMARNEINQLNEFLGMEISTLKDSDLKGVIKVAMATQ